MSVDRFVGKVAVITGASAGIGKATAVALVKKGLIVAGLARRVERIEELAKQLKNEKGKLYGFKADMTKEDEIISAFKKITETLGPIHILINNAGVAPLTSLIDGDISKWRQILDTNVLALSIGTREAIASMKASNIKGHIININSVAGHDPMDIPGISVYPASKYAVTALTESFRKEINRNKLPIKITSISPGYVKSEMAEAAFGPEAAKGINSGPGLETEDIADNIVYVLSTPEHVNIKELTVVIQGQEA